MSTTIAFNQLDNILKKNNRDIFDNRIDVRAFFSSGALDNNSSAERGIFIVLESYDIAVVSCDDMGSDVFKYMFRYFDKEYAYVSHNLEDFVEKVKDYIPSIIVDILDAKFIKGEDYILHRN